MRETATLWTRSPSGGVALLGLLSTVALLALPERSAAESAVRLVVVESPTDRSEVQRDAAGNVNVSLRLAAGADLSTFAASVGRTNVGRTNVASSFRIDPISRVGVASLSLAAGASYSLKVSVQAPRAGRAGRKDSEKVRFTVVEAEANAGPAPAAASMLTPTPTPTPTSTPIPTPSATPTPPPTPIASFTYGLTGLTIDVDGSGSNAPAGTIVDYSWDFGDGAMDSGITASHTYAQAGTYSVTLTVTDDLAGTNDAVFVVAARASNSAPTASFSYSLTGLMVSVDGAASSDPDGPIADYAWDFGDGMTDNGPTAAHSYASAGTYTVSLTVEDYPGAVDSMALVVAPRQPNGPPVASFTYITTGLEVAVDASDSSDPDGPIVDYAWNFGDGMTGTGLTASHSYAMAGTYTVSLTVEDYPGATGNDGQGVTVVPLVTPTATPTATPTSTPTATSTPTPTPTATPTATPTPTPTPMPTPVFTLVPPPHYHVNEGATLNFTVTATLGGSPLTVTESGLPENANFSGGNFSWVGEFENVDDTGRHEVTFSAGGDSTLVVVGTTEYPLVDFLLYSEPNVPLVGSITIAEGGHAQVLAGALFDNPFSEDPSPIAGRGTNSWAEFIWFIADESIASLSSGTNVAVMNGLLPGSTTVNARFTDASLGEMAAVGPLDVLRIVSIAVDPVSLSFPEGSTELFYATATLTDASETQGVSFDWSTSNPSVATVSGGSPALGMGHIANVTGHALGSATITASVPNAAMVSGAATATLVPPLRTQLLYGMDDQGSTTRIVTLDATGGAQPLASLSAPYNQSFGPADSHTTNELLVSGFAPGTGFSEIQRISALGVVTPVFTSDSLTQLGDTIDPLAIAYRPDGWAYFAMTEGSHTLSRISPAGDLSSIGGPKDPGSNEDFGPNAIAPFGNDLVFSGPWSFDLKPGFADLVARYDDATGKNDSLVSPGFGVPGLAAPGGDLRVLDPETGELFRFVDVNGDGEHFEIVGLTAQDDPGERFDAGTLPDEDLFLPSGFDTLNLDPMTGDMITTRIVGNVPQRIIVLRLDDLNADGDVDDAGEQVVVFDAGAPPGTNIRGVRLKY